MSEGPYRVGQDALGTHIRGPILDGISISSKQADRFIRRLNVAHAAGRQSQHGVIEWLRERLHRALQDEGLSGNYLQRELRAVDERLKEAGL